ncbi:MAG: hypothetical protein M1834_000150 [Cirrosporium novae-zelandiae]|nr:MAG: hypothetical protein M1834_000150 [Cirrosporium novae-zelandiae]
MQREHLLNLPSEKDALFRRKTEYVRSVIILDLIGDRNALLTSLYTVCKTCSDYGHTCLGYADSGQQTTIPEDQTRPPGQRANPSQPRNDDKEVQKSPSPEKDRDSTISQGKMPKIQEDRTPINEEHNHPPSYFDTGRKILQEHDRSSQPPTDDATSPASSLNPNARNKVPYFRYFGPTAIVPGFKQMVVQIRENQRSLNGQPKSGDSPVSAMHQPGTSLFTSASTPVQSGHEPRIAADIPFYDPSNGAPNDPLINHLCETFFIHLGCNYPFLQQERFLRDLGEKKVDAILVDAVCALAARFSSHTLISTGVVDVSLDDPHVKQEIPKPERGQLFAQRAMASIVDTFSCPSIAVVQACLLLAYFEFGANHDSGLWMYLGISIRMAQDIGIQKLEGLTFEGRVGPTPKTVKAGQIGKHEEKRRKKDARMALSFAPHDKTQALEQRANERARNDLFWAIFFLDRVVSSGTGRPVTLRDRDIEISFPSPVDVDQSGEWPAPFPPLIRIIHLYGRVTDLLNDTREASDFTPEILRKLTSMESDLTGLYQRLSPKLHFNVKNFQYYVNAGEGTNFILLHFWFHTLIVLLHQPTLLHSLGGGIQQIVPNSRELSMSSAKTIADILSFAELVDAKSFIGNPFTSQPMYIAACAFLMESAAQTASNPESRACTPPLHPHDTTADNSKSAVTENNGNVFPSTNSRRVSHTNADSSSLVHKPSTKHCLLATQATQNYQRCYQALKSLETYWAGTKYIITALDQKAKGNLDPLLYTTEEMDSAVEQPTPKPAFNTPGWRRSTAFMGPLSLGMKATGDDTQSMAAGKDMLEIPASPKIDPSHAIGWSLTGTTNSPNPSLSFLYQAPFEGTTSATAHMEFSPKASHVPFDSTGAASTQYSAVGSNVPYGSSAHGQHSRHSSLANMSTSTAKYPSLTGHGPTSRADMLLNLDSPYISNARSHQGAGYNAGASTAIAHPGYNYLHNINTTGSMDSMSNINSNLPGGIPGIDSPFADLMIESQDIDMSALRGDMIPWLEYLPQEIFNLLDSPADGVSGSAGGVQ